ncbi:hypothetical protein Tco_0513313 [Tanacetum coccineum]
MVELTTMKFDESKSMQQHVLDMTNTAARLKTLAYSKGSKNKETKSSTVNLLNQGVDKKLKPKAKNFKKKQHGTTSKVANAEKKEQMDNKCNFYRKREFLTIQTISPTNNFLYMRNRMKAPIKGVGTYRLKLDTRFHLDLMNTLYVPSISRNLISISRLDVSGYTFSGGNGRFNLYKDKSFIGYGILIDNLYKLKLDDVFSESLFTVEHNVGMKRSMVNESSAFLWHKRLGHIS